MGQPDLKVDLGLLESAAGSLGLLIEEFDSAGDIVDESSDYIGESQVTGALHSFADNWKKHRENLLKSMDQVYKMATKSHEAYISADDKLAQSIAQAMTKKDQRIPGGGR